MASVAESVRNIFKIHELRQRIIYTLLLLLVYRLGSYVTIPGIDARILEDLANDQVFQSRGAFEIVDHPDAGEFAYPGRPFIMEHSPWSIRRPAPRLGEHTGEVLSELGYSQDDISRLRREGVV